MSLSVIPLLNALALTTVVPLLTEMGPEYTLEEDVGSDPSTVNRIVAPEVAQLSVTLWGEE